MSHLEIGKDVLKQEAAAIVAAAKNLGPEFDGAVELLLRCKGRVIVIGMGKCFHISRKIAASLASTGTPAFAVHPGEAFHGDLGMITKGDVAIVISNSGETSEVTAILPIIKERGAKIVAITGKADSALARAGEFVLSSKIKGEACPFGMVPTCSTTVQLALGDALAMALVAARGFGERDFARLHPGGALGRQMRTVGKVMLPLEKLAVVKFKATIAEALAEVTAKRSPAVLVTDAAGRLCCIISAAVLCKSLSDGTHVPGDRAVSLPSGEFEAFAAADHVSKIVKSGVKQPLYPVTDPKGRLLGALDPKDI